MPQLAAIRMDLAELEVLRLCDLEGLEQQEAGLRMGISRGTVQRLVKAARAKVAQALVESSALVIEGGEDDADLHTDTG